VLLNTPQVKGGNPLSELYELTDLHHIREFFRKSVITAYQEQYKDMAETWKGLETKSQGNVAIAGIFIAGAFAIIKDILPSLLTVEKVLFSFALGFLVATIVLSILSLQVREVAEPPFGDHHYYLGKLLINALNENEFKEQISNAMNTQILWWQEAVMKAKEIILLKAKYLRTAQSLIMAAAILITALMLSKVFDLARRLP
jgi:hypothetical protein